MLQLKRYPGRVMFLPWYDDEQPAPAEAGDTGRPSSIFDGPLDLSKWREMSGQFVHFMGLNTPRQASDCCFAPYSSISDGAIDLTWIMSGVRQSKDRSVLVRGIGSPPHISPDKPGTPLFDNGKKKEGRHLPMGMLMQH